MKTAVIIIMVLNILGALNTARNYGNEDFVKAGLWVLLTVIQTIMSVAKIATIGITLCADGEMTRKLSFIAFLSSAVIMGITIIVLAVTMSDAIRQMCDDAIEDDNEDWE